MEVKFNVAGTERKELVTAISEILEIKPKYLGMPSAAYEVGNFIVDKEGIVKSEDDFGLERLVHNLIGDGFKPEESECEANVGLTVAIPRDKVDSSKLEKIVENKGDLIKKALGITSLKACKLDGKGF